MEALTTQVRAPDLLAMRLCGMRTALLAAPLLLAACIAVPDPPPPDPSAPGFDVVRFFTGRTEGRGVVRQVAQSPQQLIVRSEGRVETGGALIVHQVIAEGHKPVRSRDWRVREVAPGRFAGTLSDASGPVTGRAQHNRLRLDFRMKGGLDARQWLTLQPGGNSVRNVMIVSKLGVPVATVEETIRKLD